MELLDEVIKIQEDIQKSYENLVKSPDEKVTQAAIHAYRDRLELLRTLREATFLATVIEDDRNKK